MLYHYVYYLIRKLFFCLHIPGSRQCHDVDNNNIAKTTGTVTGVTIEIGTCLVNLIIKAFKFNNLVKKLLDRILINGISRIFIFLQDILYKIKCLHF